MGRRFFVSRAVGHVGRQIAACALVLMGTACSAGSGTGASSLATAPAETSTTTVTETTTKTVTKTTTTTAPGTTTMTSDVPETRRPTEAAPATQAFNAARAKTVTARIVEDVTEIDKRVAEGSEGGMRLSMLADNFSDLADAGTPPGAPADYQAQLATLADFANQAFDLEYDEPMTSAAKYLTLRRHVAHIVTAVNAATGSTFSLPSS